MPERAHRHAPRARRHPRRPMRTAAAAPAPRARHDDDRADERQRQHLPVGDAQEAAEQQGLEVAEHAAVEAQEQEAAAPSASACTVPMPPTPRSTVAASRLRAERPIASAAGAAEGEVAPRRRKPPSSAAPAAPGKAIIESVCPANVSRRRTMNQPDQPRHHRDDRCPRAAR